MYICTKRKAGIGNTEHEQTGPYYNRLYDAGNERAGDV